DLGIAVGIFSVIETGFGPAHTAGGGVGEGIAFLVLGVAFLPEPSCRLSENFVDRRGADLARDVTHLLPVGDLAASYDVNDGIDDVENETGALLRILHVFFVFGRPLLAGAEIKV